MAYVNGLWYTEVGDSIEFVAGERYAERGVFVASRPAEAVVIDLGGAFIVPPFSEVASSPDHMLPEFDFVGSVEKILNVP